MFRRIAASYWTVALCGEADLVAHGWWLSRSNQPGEVLSGLGASLVVIGLIVAARPFLRVGIDRMASQQVSPFPFGVFASEEGVDEWRKTAAIELYIARRDVIAERIIAVVVIGVGTLLNGYGFPLARFLSLNGA